MECNLAKGETFLAWSWKLEIMSYLKLLILNILGQQHKEVEK